MTHTAHSEFNYIRDSVWLTAATCILVYQSHLIDIVRIQSPARLILCYTNYLYTTMPVTLSGQSESSPMHDSLCVTHTNTVYTPERDSRAGIVRLDTITQWTRRSEKCIECNIHIGFHILFTLFYATHTNCLQFTRLRSGNKERVTT